MIRVSLLLTLFTCSLFANEFDSSTLMGCQRSGELYSDGFNNEKIQSICQKQIFSRAESKQKWISPDKSILAYGFNNILFVRYDENKNFDLMKYSEGNKVEILSGTRPRLNELHYLKINEEDKEIVTLVNDDHAIHTYYLGSNGNLDPIRYLESKELKGCDSLAIDRVNQKLIVSCPQEQALKVFRLKAYMLGRIPEMKTDLLYKLTGSETEIDTPKDIVASEQELYVLDKNKILVFALNASGNIKPKNIYPIKGKYERLQINKNELIGIKKSGKTSPILKIK